MMRGRTVVSKVLQNIGPFRKGMFKELWNMPNVVLRYGSFNPVKRAEALVRAGELGAAVRALTSEVSWMQRSTSRNYRNSIHKKALQWCLIHWTACMVTPHPIHTTLHLCILQVIC